VQSIETFKPERRTDMAFDSEYFHRAPSADVINAVLQYADIEEDLGGGRFLNRLSSKRLRQREVRKALGDAVARAADVSVVWDERQGQIVRVLDAAAS